MKNWLPHQATGNCCGSRSAFGRLQGKKFFTLHSSFFTFALHSSLIIPSFFTHYTFMHGTSHFDLRVITLWWIWHDGVINVSSGCNECSDRVWRMFRWGGRGYATTVQTGGFRRSRKVSDWILVDYVKASKLAYFRPNPVLLISIRFSRFFVG